MMFTNEKNNPNSIDNNKDNNWWNTQKVIVSMLLSCATSSLVADIESTRKNNANKTKQDIKPRLDWLHLVETLPSNCT